MTVSTMANGLTVERLIVEFARGGQMVRALNDISFSVEAGSMLLILGPSGCGKTTLLSCLAGLRRPTSGTIRHGNVAVETLDRGSLDAYRRRVGIIFQAFNLVESLTSAENVAVPLRSAGTSERQSRQRAVTLLESVGLADCVDRRPGQLSGGQQQRVAVARALALDPPLVIADEPTAHLDQHNVEATLRLLRRLTDEGRIVIVSTHDTRLVPLAEQTIDLAPSTLPTGASPGLIELEDGQELFHEGDGSDWIYFVVSGSVDLIQGDLSVASAGVGDWFGEMGPLFSLPRSATARACGFTVVEPVSVGEFRSRLGLATLRDLLGRRSETY
jgi:putative ABC transport system ATP-binding protein